MLLPFRCPYIIEVPSDISFILFRRSSVLPCCYDSSTEETMIL
jgi:hypothetical protein